MPANTRKNIVLTIIDGGGSIQPRCALYATYAMLFQPTDLYDLGPWRGVCKDLHRPRGVWEGGCHFHTEAIFHSQQRE